jgi:hypothetical protein
MVTFQRLIKVYILFPGTPINYKGNPSVDFTMIRFLERFAHRNPKKQGEPDAEESENDEVPSKRRKKETEDEVGSDVDEEGMDLSSGDEDDSIDDEEDSADGNESDE